MTDKVDHLIEAKEAIITARQTQGNGHEEIAALTEAQAHALIAIAERLGRQNLIMETALYRWADSISTETVKEVLGGNGH